MVVPSFSCKDFFDYLLKNANGINRLFYDLNRRWNKSVREAKDGQSVSLWMEGEYEHNRFVIIRHAESKQTAIRSFNDVNLCFVPVDNGKFQVFEWKNNGRIFVYSSHFFDRYKERMNLKGSKDKAIRTYFKKTDVMMRVYGNPKTNQIVFANEDGLALGVYEKEKDLEVCCTFVDYSLLKASQRAAFNKAIPYFDNVRNITKKMRRNGCSTWQAEDFVNDKYEDLSSTVEEIYAEHFHRYDLC